MRNSRRVRFVKTIWVLSQSSIPDRVYVVRTVVLMAKWGGRTEVRGPVALLLRVNGRRRREATAS